MSCGVEGSYESVAPTRTPPAASVAPISRTTGTPTPSDIAPPRASAAPRTVEPVIVVRYRVDVRIADDDGFAAFLARVMADRRGWERARFVVRESGDAPYRVVLAEGDEVDELCRPYDTGGKFSCQNGPVVAINADRWRDGVPHWPEDLEHYRTMLVNHEMGHLLGQHHLDCPGAGQLAPVMQQQSGGLDGCRANAWPLDAEIARAARHDLKLAPEFGE